MNLRHLRSFIAVAEELHFGRAARRLHVGQSPLSRTIRRLETDLGVVLLDRTPHGVFLTAAGQVFLLDAQRVLQTLEQAQTNVQTAAAGYRNTLRVALSSHIGKSRLPALLALCRKEVPEVAIRLFETPKAELVLGLGTGLYDLGLTLDDGGDAGLIATSLWEDPVVVALPTRHPLLAFKEIPLREVFSYPLVLCDSKDCNVCTQQRERLFRSVEAQPIAVEYVTSHSLMLTLVAAGYGVGFSSAGHLANCQHFDVVARPLADQTALMTTYLLRRDGEMTESLRQFVNRAQRVGRLHTADERSV
ncbi:MAG: LysR family transcriptional regulator [Burkholderiales bacterium]|nr:LysR family transcriptional regulator [Burkholderiales bacterium]